MANSKNQIGFDNQKFLLAILLIDVWKDINWSYEGKNENEADFQIGDNIYQAKTFVDGKATYIKNSVAPNEIKKAVFQLFRNKSIKKRYIITNKKIMYKGENTPLEDNVHDFFQIFKREKLEYKNKVFNEEELQKIKIIVKGVSNGDNTKEISDKAIDTFRNYLSKNMSNLNIDSLAPFRLALDSFIASISRNISEDNLKNPMRHNLFYSVAELNAINIDLIEEADLKKLESGVDLICSLQFMFINEEKIKKELSKLNFLDEEIERLISKQREIQKWSGILK